MPARIKIELYCVCCKMSLQYSKFSHVNVYKLKEERRCKICVRQNRKEYNKQRNILFYQRSRVLRGEEL